MMPQAKLDVSVIIPVFNQAESLKVTLKHFAHQTYRADQYEIIVIDDGSTDGLQSRIGEVDWPHLQLIRYIRQENRGRAAARNTGAALAKGHLLIFCDADRVPQADFIFRHTESAKRGKEKP